MNFRGKKVEKIDGYLRKLSMEICVYYSFCCIYEEICFFVYLI